MSNADKAAPGRRMTITLTLDEVERERGLPKISPWPGSRRPTARSWGFAFAGDHAPMAKGPLKAIDSKIAAIQSAQRAELQT